jgi:hypothetical protein
MSAENPIMRLIIYIISIISILLFIIFSSGVFALEYKDSFTFLIASSLVFLAGSIFVMLNTGIQFDYKLPIMITLTTFMCAYLLFIAQYHGFLDRTIGSLVITFGKIIDFFEDSSYGGTIAKGLGGLIFLGLLVGGIVTMSNDNTQRPVSKGIGIGVFFSLLLVVLFGSMFLVEKFRKGKFGSVVYDKMMQKPNSFWFIFSLMSMGTALPLAFFYDGEDDDNYKKDIKSCNTRKEKQGGGFSMDTQEEIKECEEETRKDYKNKVPLKEYPLLGLLVFLICGFGVISRKEIFEFLSKDKFRNIIVLFSLFLLITFIIFQVNSERYYEKNYPRTKTEPAIPDSYYIPANLTFITLGTICFLSLITLSWNIDNYDRPDTNKIWESTKWLTGKLSKYFKLLLTMVASASIIFCSIYFYTGKKTYESGAANIVYLMLGLALLTMLYGALKQTDFIKNSSVLKILLNLLLLIPCLLFFIVEFVYNDIKDTPKLVFAVLLGEISLVTLYIIVPLILKYFFGHYVGKNNTNTYELKKQQLDIKLGEMKDHYENIRSRVNNVIKQEDWENILNNGYYGSVDNIKKYFEKTRKIPLDPTVVNVESVDEKMEIEIQKISENPGYKSKNRYDQIMNFVYYFITNQLPDETYINKISVRNIKEKEDKYKMEREYVEEKIKVGKVHKSIVLIDKPVYLDSMYVPKKENGKNASFQDLEPHLMTDSINDFSYNYGLSLWTNIHTQGPNFRYSSNKFTKIIDYAQNPLITYNSKDDILRVQITIKLPKNLCCDNNKNDAKCVPQSSIVDGKTLEVVKQWCADDMTKNTLNNENERMLTIFEKEGLMKKQKWNNIVINYDLGVLDVFVNGKLEGTWNGTLQYMGDRKIEIGENNGIAGGICNVVYYPSALTKSQIEFFYNTLKLNNPPII